MVLILVAARDVHSVSVCIPVKGKADNVACMTSAVLSHRMCCYSHVHTSVSGGDAWLHSSIMQRSLHACVCCQCASSSRQLTTVRCRTMLLLSDTYSMVPILVHEFGRTACDQAPQLILSRARLYRVAVPPDQLNPNGYYDGNLDEAFLTRFTQKKKRGRADLRASAKHLKLPSPGELHALRSCWSARVALMASQKWVVSCSACSTSTLVLWKAVCAVQSGRLQDVPNPSACQALLRLYLADQQ